MMGQLIDIEAMRLRRWQRKQDAGFKTMTDEQAVWVCRCGCWQYELRPIGVYCVNCGTKQSVAIKV